jgi:DNA-binding Lrp family transcriptional regulator
LQFSKNLFICAIHLEKFTPNERDMSKHLKAHSKSELAEKVGLSISPCHRRVKALEESGAIKGYRAELDPNSR